MKRRQFEHLTIREAKEITMAALLVADRLFVSQGSGDVRTIQTFKQACIQLRDLRDALDRRLSLPTSDGDQ